MPHPILHGYHGKILEIDLTAGRVSTRPLEPEWVEEYLGGRGLATRILHGEIDPGCDPLGPENVLVLATSPLVGTKAPTACRGHMTFKSPLTGAYGYANSGGFFVAEMRHAGYDALLITGRAPQPSVLCVEDGEICVISKIHDGKGGIFVLNYSPNLRNHDCPDTCAEIRRQVERMCKEFPVPGI